MSGQARIEALQAPLGTAPAAVPLMRVFVRELAEGEEVVGLVLCPRAPAVYRLDCVIFAPYWGWTE